MFTTRITLLLTCLLFTISSHAEKKDTPTEKWQVIKPAEDQFDPFYKKLVLVHGYPIVSSEKVNDYALKEAAYLIDLLLKHRPDVLKALVKNKSRLAIMAHNEYTMDIPEHRKALGRAARGEKWWNRRARGLGGSKTLAVASCGEENLLCFPGDPYHEENILIHEFAHMIHIRGMNVIDKTFDKRLEATYQAAMKKGLWKTKYAANNRNEYFAEGVQSWFNNNRKPDHDHNHVDTRKELIEYDPGLAKLCEEVFGKTELKYIKPQHRKDQAHMTGYDYSKSPRFEWPKELKEINPRS